MITSLLDIHEVVLLVTTIESALLALGVALLPRQRSQSHRFLIALLLQIALILGCTLIVWNPHLQQSTLAGSSVAPALLAFGLLAHGPTLYLYMRSLPQPVVLSHWHNWVHYVPACAAVVTILVTDIRLSDWLPWNWPALPHHKNQIVRSLWAIYKCQPLIYAALCCLAEYRLRRQMELRYASLPQWELRWAEFILGGFSLHWTWAFVAYWVSGYVSTELNSLMGNISNYVTVILINGLFIFAMLGGRKALILPEVSETTFDSKPIDQYDEKLQRVEKAINTDHIHLDTHVNLDRFSQHCRLKPREVSTLINTHYHQNFFEFINYHRVQEVKRRLRRDSGDTILDIALQSGFNSQSAFQRFFKRLEGVAPSQYRREVKQSTATRRESKL